jgi:V/A-type H+-transporting ATPase subunit D
MIRAPRVAPTRINLLSARRRLGQVQRGAALIRRKRDALVRELFRLARPAADVRAEIAAEFVGAYNALLGAFARHGRAGLRAIAWPSRPMSIRIEPAQVWGVSVSDLAEHAPIRRALDARGIAPATAGPAATDAARRFEAIADRLLDAAAAEQRLRRIGEAVAEESRHLRTLEQRVAPSLGVQIVTLKRALQEREREEYLRLKHLQTRRAGARAGHRRAH